MSLCFNLDDTDDFKMCENCKYYKQNILIPCQGRCKVVRVKRNWNSNSCQFYEANEQQTKK